MNSTKKLIKILLKAKQNKQSVYNKCDRQNLFGSKINHFSTIMEHPVDRLTVLSQQSKKIPTVYVSF